MAQQQNLMDYKTLCCSICLDLLRDPVTIPCGHNYCMNCIKRQWDEERQKKTYSCPQCRQTFIPRPALVKNTMLADLVEETKKTGLHAAPADHCYAGPGDVACDVCTGRKLKATKSCLQCLHHFTTVKIFCRADQQCNCDLCSMNKHNDHDTVSAAAERTEWQRELGQSRRKIQQRIQDREKDVKVLQQEVEAISRSADETVGTSEKIFTELVRLVEKKSSDVKQQVRTRQKTEVSRAKELLEKLQQEITELRRKDTELEQLSHTNDHVQFLHNYPRLSRLSGSTDSPGINIHPLQYFEAVTAAVSEVRDKLQDILMEKWKNISQAETQVMVLQPQAESVSRAEFLQYSYQITLDPNSANTQLLLSEGNRKATVMKEKQAYPQHPDRFTNMFQVLNRESLSGRHYWEVERSRYEVSVAVTYKDISRTGYESGFGNDDKSWTLECFNSGYEFRHNSIRTPIYGPPSTRIGVYLDHRAGILSFYRVSNPMTLLHSVQTTFTQPLYAGLGVFGSWGGESAAVFCNLSRS